ncbi:hypothetical protein [Streptomyces sp. NPDC047079]|uniref:hypothetical protein n=1 Tax=Streptomyces sp. NPDC047079 TaxID=3154607 RepID=UPI0033E7CF4A
MKELTAIRKQLERLDDPTVGLTALHGEVTQSRLKILEKIEGGVIGLHEENREVRQRQDRMISDLKHTWRWRSATDSSYTAPRPGRVVEVAKVATHGTILVVRRIV